MKGSLYTLFYAAALGAVCALLLSGAGWATAERIEKNARAEEVRNILGVLDVPTEVGASARRLVEIFEENVRKETHGEASLYVYRDGAGAVAAVAVTLGGPGLWGPIEGFLALEPDMRTIRGVTFHKQEETPGLGGEIASEEFRDRFRGKSIRDADGAGGFTIAPGAGALPSGVDAITGATMTCEKVEAILTAAIESLAPVGALSDEER